MNPLTSVRIRPGLLLRLFIAAPVPPLEAVEALAGQVSQRVPGARIPREGWHVTLRFLGEVDDPAPVERAMREALSRATAAPGRIVGVGAFPNARRANVLWAGVQARGLEGIAGRVTRATLDLGEKPEKRVFVPHVTLARLRAPRDVSAFLAPYAGVEFGQAPFDEVALFASRPEVGGSVYERIASVRLPSQASMPAPGSP